MHRQIAHLRSRLALVRPFVAIGLSEIQSNPMKSYPMIVRPALLALSLATITVGSHAAPFQNGSFETPTIPTGGQTLPSGSTSIDGWITGGAGTLSFVRGVTFGIDPADGLQQIAFNGGDTVTGATSSVSKSADPAQAAAQ